MDYYTGVGSRKTPPVIRSTMMIIGKAMARAEIGLRSGGADGADSMFEMGCDEQDGLKNIYLPWKGFNNNKSDLYLDTMPKKAEAYNIAEAHHPAWHKCNSAARLFHTRNVFQVLGSSLICPSRI